MEDERRALRVLRTAGTAVLVLFVVMTAVGPSRPVTANPPGFATPVAGIELASTPEHVIGILGVEGSPARPAVVWQMRVSLLLDLLFLVAYPTFTVGIALLLRARGRLGPGTAAIVFVLAAVMSIGDLLENREIWLLTWLGDPAEMAPVLARLRVFTLVKWYAIFLSCAILAVGVARERGGGGGARRSSPSRRSWGSRPSFTLQQSSGAWRRPASHGP